MYNQLSLSLKHWHHDVFNIAEGSERFLENLKLNFRTDAEGNVASVEIPFESSLSPISFKRRPDRRLSSAEFLARVAGTFELKDRTVNITATPDGLVWAESNQPFRHLLPGLGGVYRVKERPGRIVKIKESSDGSVVGFDVIEAAGVFAWKRKN